MPFETSWVERFYTHFLGRDLLYIFSGGLFICTAEYAVLGKIFLPQGLSLEVIGFIMISYFIGQVIYRLDFYFDITSHLPMTLGYPNLMSFEQALIKNYDERILNQLERYIFFMNIGKSVGVTSLFGGILMIIFIFIRMFFSTEPTTIEYILLAVSLLIYGIFMIFDARYWVCYLKEVRTELAKEMTYKMDIQMEN